MNIGKENEKTEFKKSTSESKQAIVSMSSILNKHGSGVLFFGVDNNGDVVGQQIGIDTLNKLSQDIANSIRPVCNYSIELKSTSDSKQFIQVDFKGNNTPYSSYGRYYLRFHDEDRIMTNEMLRDFYLSSRKDYSSWEKENSLISHKSVDIEKLKEYANESKLRKRINYEYTNTKDFLGKLGLLYDDEYLNNAGNVLFSSLKPVQFKLAKFAGETRSIVLDLNIFEGNIYECIEEGMNFFSSNVNWPIYFDGSIKRIEKPEIPIEAVREILVNAFSHGDYNSFTSFELDIYSNRISIYSPGFFPKPYSPEEFANKGIEPIPLNILINNVLYKDGTIEQFSTGFDRVFKALEKEKISYSYEDTGNGFRFVFYRPGQNKTMLTKTEEKVYKELKNNNKITARKMAEKLDLSERTINRALSKLKSINYVVREGSDKDGNWYIVD